MRRRAVAGLCAGALLVSAGCGGGEEKPPPQDPVDAIIAPTADIVFQCRAVQRGFSTLDTQALDRDVDELVEAGEQFDLDAPFRLPPPAVDPETTLREQVELAIARLEEDGCSPEHAERLRDAIED